MIDCVPLFDVECLLTVLYGGSARWAGRLSSGCGLAAKHERKR